MLAAASRQVLGARRETNSIRRRGTGRQTTKRSFGLKLPAPAVVKALAGRKSCAPLKEAGVEGSANEFERLRCGSLDLASDSQCPITTGEVPVIALPVATSRELNEHAAEDLSTTVLPPDETEQNEEGSPASEYLSGGASDGKGSAVVNAAPTPFRRANRLLRTPAHPTSSIAEEDVTDEGSSCKPVLLTFDTHIGQTAESTDENDETEGHSAVSSGHTQSGLADQHPPLIEQNSMRTSPVQMSDGDFAPPVERRSFGASPIQPVHVSPTGSNHYRTHKSMGTSPILSSATIISGVTPLAGEDDDVSFFSGMGSAIDRPSSPPSHRARSRNATPTNNGLASSRLSEASDFAAGDTPEVDGVLSGSGEALARRTRPTVGQSYGPMMPHFCLGDQDGSDSHTECNVGAGVDDDGMVDNEGDAAHSDVIHARSPPPPPAQPPPSKKCSAPGPSRTSKRTGGAGRRTRKTSLDNIGRLPETALVSGAAPTGQGQRMSKRKRFRPLEYWRGERVIYGRRASSKFEAIVDVTILEAEPTPPHFRRQRRRAAAASSKDDAPDDALEQGGVAEACALATQ